MTNDLASIVSQYGLAIVFGSVLVAVIGLFLVLLLTEGPGGHGPARHKSAALDLPIMGSFTIGS